MGSSVTYFDTQALMAVEWDTLLFFAALFVVVEGVCVCIVSFRVSARVRGESAVAVAVARNSRPVLWHH